MTRAGRREAALGALFVSGATLFWGLSGTLARFIFRDRHVPPFTAVEMRLAVALLVLGPWLVLRRPATFRVRGGDVVPLALLGLIGVAAVQGTYYYALATLGVGLAILIQYLAPALVVIHDLTRGVRPPPRMLAAVGAALVGIVLLVGDLEPAAGRAGALAWLSAFASAATFAFSIVWTKRVLTHCEPETAQFYSFAVAWVLFAVITPPWRIAQAGYDGGTWLLFAALGIFSVLIPVRLFYAGLKRMTASRASVLATLEPPIAIVSSSLFLGEGLRPLQWVGAVLILSASVLTSTDPAVTAPEHP